MNASIRNFAYCTILILSSGLLVSCDAGILSPKGAVGVAEKELLFIALGLMLIVAIPTLIMTVYFACKYKEKGTSEYLPDWNYSGKIELFVWLIPIIIIILLGIVTWYSTFKLDPYRPLDSNKKPLVIQVVSLDWKWLFIYPEYNVATVGEIAFPVNRPVTFQITSATVMSSFFIPRLGSQIYSMAGMETKLNLIANEPGVYKGVNTGYSGHGYSYMKFKTIVTANDQQFKQWLNKVRHSQYSLSTSQEYAALAKQSFGYPVTYYSSVKKDLFRGIINKFMH